jgi:hypothetical protein
MKPKVLLLLLVCVRPLGAEIGLMKNVLLMFDRRLRTIKWFLFTYMTGDRAIEIDANYVD